MSFPLRVGQGFDVHALVEGRPLIIGGVLIPHTHGLLGHSDADVLLHAITDAILGAAGMGDIGRHFPDTDPRYKGADSRALLRAAMEKVAQASWHVVNIDATVHAQAPKIAPHAAAMVANIAADLGIEPWAVNIKAKTNEGLGYLGRKEGIAASVVALLKGAEPD
jgi:2-C-methyl-D-erythritol 2,4-cyclodiphosphate synthase